MDTSSKLTDELALSILAREGVAAIWKLHLCAADAHRTGPVCCSRHLGNCRSRRGSLAQGRGNPELIMLFEIIINIPSVVNVRQHLVPALWRRAHLPCRAVRSRDRRCWCPHGLRGGPALPTAHAVGRDRSGCASHGSAALLRSSERCIR
jgi:hypothetical protein